MRLTRTTVALFGLLSSASANEIGETQWKDATANGAATVRACAISSATDSVRPAWDSASVDRKLVLIDLTSEGLSPSGARYLLLLLEGNQLNPYCGFTSGKKRSDGCGGLMTDTLASCEFDLMLKTAKPVKISRLDRSHLDAHAAAHNCGSVAAYLQSEAPQTGAGGGAYLCDIKPANGEPYRLAPLNE